MIRILFRQMLDNKAFKEGRKITIGEVAEETGISRATMNRIANTPGCNTTLEVIDALCGYFDCKTEDLLLYIKPEERNK